MQVTQREAGATVEVRSTDKLQKIEAQAEVFLLAFQALPREAQWVVREWLVRVEPLSSELASELESWQAAGSEALLFLRPGIDKRRIVRVIGRLESEYGAQMDAAIRQMLKHSISRWKAS
jgi:hypothetical protein